MLIDVGPVDMAALADHKASQQFFERLGLVSLLGDTEVHSLITTAAKNLLSVAQRFQRRGDRLPIAGIFPIW